MTQYVITTHVVNQQGTGVSRYYLSAGQHTEVSFTPELDGAAQYGTPVEADTAKRALESAYPGIILAVCPVEIGQAMRITVTLDMETNMPDTDDAFQELKSRLGRCGIAVTSIYRNARMIPVKRLQPQNR